MPLLENNLLEVSHESEQCEKRLEPIDVIVNHLGRLPKQCLPHQTALASEEVSHDHNQVS